MTSHQYKIWPSYFDAVCDQRKLFEVRRDDRKPTLIAGDIVFLDEWCPDEKRYLGRRIAVRVTYIVRGHEASPHGLPEGMMVFGFQLIGVESGPTQTPGDCAFCGNTCEPYREPWTCPHCLVLYEAVE